MSRYVNEAFAFDFATDMGEARQALYLLQQEREVDAQYERHMNPLALEASDLDAVGWDTDPMGGTWFHCEHGVKSFLDACRVEANKVSPAVLEIF